jgi:hypothetical protein
MSAYPRNTANPPNNEERHAVPETTANPGNEEQKAEETSSSPWPFCSFGRQKKQKTSNTAEEIQDPEIPQEMELSRKIKLLRVK